MVALSYSNLKLELASGHLSAFYPLLQQGVRVGCRVGCRLGELLSDQWGISPEYVAQRVTTIFLNSRAIDDVHTALVGPDAVIALSGAMPGLVGATMRRGGYYAAMRGAMTHHEETGTGGCTEAVVRVKLFNLLLGELGPGFLERGILLTGTELFDFFRDQGPEFRRGCRSARLNGLAIDPETLGEDADLARIESIRLTVECRDFI
ncbi:hypothetical protein OR1_03768 [Geobacter sp. OR-1]|uniref:hypothetical protein n=1 Tax=Geobacter sp. OR-1 TaxID=1266765 RepID=UPI0005440FCB|nr:hypothetical protein [Geobacter sp. OR-1]GAM11452.1 hypothetical protein OR1_03768 [Geobacter sp. OR-1]